MGLIRFLVPQLERIPAAAISQAYMVGIDEVPWTSRIVTTEDGLIVDRPVGESGYFHIPWRVDGCGEMMLSTASLMERDEPYLLEVELARGTLNRIRNQLANWELVGMVIAEPIRTRLSAATETFSRAATSQNDAVQASDLAAEVLAESLAITVSLGTTYAQQTLAKRHAAGSKLVTLLGANLGSVPLDDSLARYFLGTFNSAIAPMSWDHVEGDESQYDWKLSDSQLDWCKTHALKICSGPLVQLDGTEIPDWLYLWEGDLENVMSLVGQYVRAVVSRYRGQLHVWQAASRINSGSFLGLSRQDTLRVAIFVVETIREIDPQTPVVITFDQPWGDFLSRQESELPVYLADTLVRSNLGLAGVGLEMKLAYHPGGTYRRDVLEFSRQLDRWSMLGLPLLISLIVPGGSGSDPLARMKSTSLSDEWSPQRQEEWVREYIPVILGKQAVQGIIWNQFCDAHPHQLPHGGLIDAENRPKPTLATLAAIRKAHLG